MHYYALKVLQTTLLSERSRRKKIPLILRNPDVALDPANVIGHLGIDSRVAPEGAAAAPRHDAAEHLGLPLAASERASGVALARVAALLAGAHHRVGLELAAVGSLTI